MASKRKSKKSVSKIPPETRERIVAIALQHPELGARRLVPLLKKKRITVSASSIQSILRRAGLQTREKRIARLKRKGRNPKPRRPTPAPKITAGLANRIVTLSLKNPQWGARRLAYALARKDVEVSTSGVYAVLKRNGLQNRQKRRVRAAEAVEQPPSFPKKFAHGVPREVEDRIVALSLQNPDYGARRLRLLLQQEDLFVSDSAVYKILKRNDIENRQKRLLRLEAQQPADARPATEAKCGKPLPAAAEDEATETVLGPAVAAAIAPGMEEPVSAEEPAPEPAFVPPISGESPPMRTAPLKPTRKRSHWVFYLLYLLLFILIGYLGFHAVQAIQYARLETQTVAALGPAGAPPAQQPDASKRPLSDYQIIWKRNLFNITAVKDSDTEERISLDKIALAKKDLGLELVGTVVANNPKMSRAIIDNRKTREQEAYREGDNAGKVKIKKILRNNVVITTAKGDELLTVEIKESSIRSSTSAPTGNVGSRSSALQQTPRGVRSRARTRSIKVKREEVEASLSDINTFMEQIRITPYMQGNQPSGFRISRIPADSVLRKMGLRSRDVIVGLNGESITDPSQAPDFFQRLAAQDEVVIRVKRRRRTRQIKLSLE